jgi:hypothetical protein
MRNSPERRGVHKAEDAHQRERQRRGQGILVDRAIALTADTATIRNPTPSTITTYHRYNKPALGPLGDSLEDAMHREQKKSQ